MVFTDDEKQLIQYALIFLVENIKLNNNDYKIIASITQKFKKENNDNE